MKKFFYENGLSLFLGLIFLILVFMQIVSGYRVYNSEQRDHSQAEVTMTQYLGKGHFMEAIFENWESEFLQMGAYVLLTVILRQKGSAESNKLYEEENTQEDPEKRKNDPGVPSPVKKGGWRLAIYKNSLSLAFLLLFLLSFLGHAFGGMREYNEQQSEHNGEQVSLVGFVETSEFWFQSFQNWQSEFLAVLSIVYLSIYLRQQGSSESKPVFAPHTQTGKQ